MKTDPTDGKPGLRLETAASLLARDLITQHLRQFAHVITKDKAASQSTMLTYIDGLAGVMSCAIVGNLGSHDEITAYAIAKLRTALERDLKALRRT